MRITTGVLEALHRMRLTSACLAVSKNGRVVSLEDRADSMLSSAIVDLFLR